MKYQYMLVVMFTVAVFASYYSGYTPLLSGVLYLVFSLLTYLVYAKDKRAAQSGKWRVSEKTLQLFSLCGGWPGAVIAQQTLRHKTKKTAFRMVFWFTVLLNISGFVWLHTAQRQSYLRNGIYQLENAVIDYSASPRVMSVILMLTRYKGNNGV